MALIRRMLLVSAMAVLLLLAWNGLVFGPTETVGSLPPLARETAATWESGAEAPQTAEAGQRASLREEAALPARPSTQALRPKQADASGYVITGRSWADTVYAACPPEGFFG